MNAAPLNETLEKRKDLILDYISQILVYGSNVNGDICLDKHAFEDGKYMIMTVSVIKNSYFRWHDLGIKTIDSVKLYKLVFNSIVDKFKKFNLSIVDNKLVIKSDVNKNVICVAFSLDKKTEIDWFDKVKCQV